MRGVGHVEGLAQTVLAGRPQGHAAVLVGGEHEVFAHGLDGPLSQRIGVEVPQHLRPAAAAAAPPGRAA